MSEFNGNGPRAVQAGRLASTRPTVMGIMAATQENLDHLEKCVLELEAMLQSTLDREPDHEEPKQYNPTGSDVIRASVPAIDVSTNILLRVQKLTTKVSELQRRLVL